MRARPFLLVVPLGGLVAVCAAACGVADFDPQSKIDSVRILASRADKPYAKPGDTVKIEVLTADERADRTVPLTMYWIPLVCMNPQNDAYYQCFAPGDAGGGGAGSGGLSALRPGVDLTPLLKTGPTFEFTMPADAVRSHPPVAGIDTPYGLAILFNVACAGHLQITDVNASTLQQVPIGCFDAAGRALDPSQYVIGYTRVYAYDERVNANPVIEKVRFKASDAPDFVDVDPSKPVTIARCTTALRRDCPELKFDVSVTPDSWEVNASDRDANGAVRHEQIWVDYYANAGQLGGGARLLYDPARGKIDGTEVTFQAPSEIGDGTLWIVVHDNRTGVAWTQVTLQTR